MSEWVENNSPPSERLVDVKVRHCNPSLNLPDRVVTGREGEDGFYLHDGGELSWNWDIIAWRERKEG